MIIIIELKTYSNSLNISELFIERINNVFVDDYCKLYEFLDLFFNNEKKLYIGNYKVDSKSSYIINLLDYESIANQLTLKKGTILYDYLIEELNEKTELTDIKEIVDMKLKCLLDEVTSNKTIDYDFNFDIDLSKIISNFIKFDIDLTIENYIKVIKQLIYNLKKKNLKKMIVILINTNLFKEELDDLGDIIIFKFYSKNFPNIMISNEIINIDLNLLTNQLLLNWPTNIENSKIKNIIKRFFKDFAREMITNDIELYIGYKLIIKLLDLSIECKLEEENYLPEIYKNYINSL